ncbi:hypothetical protein FON45_13730 [Enterococcus faecium]|uniref:hypothetical protein n=1 Tax=Enterococcus TaxID=1350 RepID=UPI000CF2D61C|nr:MULTISPECIES: hypothetical protein [Enterococcus]EGP5125920.1 hypothetical protein [Enterococcus faecium]EHK2906401.1 hypothetical protein [Enterococcus faecium]MBE2901412.1 hypothetical protein [Enterococcus faecium]MBG0347354.1 hypothetical protein [Enterococcus faecium]MBG0383814.1 hypothetical protein [Enterococcus faecium]
MVLKQANNHKKLEREFELLNKKNEVRRKSFRNHHLILKEQADSQSIRVSKRLERFSSQNR